MAQNGMFRNAFRGFNKQDVLQYIDEITAAWDEERKALEQRANDAEEAQAALQAAADEALAQAAAAAEQQQVAETQLAEAQQQLFDTTADLSVAATTIEEMATQLEEAQRRTAQLEQELAATADERDAAIAALADAKEQAAEAQAFRQQLEESRRLVSSQTEQIASMSRTIQRYESILGDADTAAQKMDGIVRPFIEQASRQANDTLDGVQNALSVILGQLADLQNDIDQRRQNLRHGKADSDARLSDTLNQWLAAAQGSDTNGSGFFR